MTTIFDEISLNLELLIQDDTVPLVASLNAASRDNSVANGLSGIKMALFEYGTSKEGQLFGDVPNSVDIFSATLNFADGGFALMTNDEDCDLSQLGDIFTGFCNRHWSSLVTNIPSPAVMDEFITEKTEDRSLAHGQLIRAFTLHLCGISDSRDFSDQLSSLDRPGWCNGSGGIIVCLGTLDFLSRDANKYELKCLDLAKKIVSELEFGFPEIGLSICHGAAGIQAILSGLFRLYGNTEFYQLAEKVAKLIMSRHKEVLVDASTYFDNSWLTGNAGVLWSQAVFYKRPTLNPIFPIDAVIYANDHKG